MNILITGGCGFIGSHLCEKLISTYPTSALTIIDALYENSTEENIHSIQSNVTFYKEKLQNKEFLFKLFETHKFEYVIHMAAQTHVDTSYDNAIQFTYDNILATHVLLEVVRQIGCVKKFMYVSTDEVYGSTSNLEPNTTSSLLEPSNPYSATKASAEMLVKSYIHSFNLNACIVRMNNVYGPRQHPEKMIGRFFLLRNSDLPITIHGDGLQKRSMLYVEDAADALLCVFMNAKQNEIINIPSVNEYSVIEIAKYVCEYMNKDFLVEYVKDRPFNDRRYWISDDRLSKLGWVQATSFEDGLKKTLEWYTFIDIKMYWKSFYQA